MAPHSRGEHHAQDDEASARRIEYRDLESEVLPTYWSDVLAWLGHAAADRPPRRILDIGAGTGFATIAMAKQFASAEVIALDVDGEALATVRRKAGKALVADRVVTLEADLDHVWPPDLDSLELTWASMSLHHLADPERVLRALYATTTQGGLVAVAEAGDDLRVLPDELGVGRPGLEHRCLEAQAAEHTRTLPTLGDDWATHLRNAGFAVLDERTVALDEQQAVLPATARFAELRLTRIRAGLGDQLAADDLAALDALLDEGSPHYVGSRSDFTVLGSRALTLAAVAS